MSMFWKWSTPGRCTLLQVDVLDQGWLLEDRWHLGCQVVAAWEGSVGAMTRGFSLDLSSHGSKCWRFGLFVQRDLSWIHLNIFSRVSCPYIGADTNGPLVVLFNAFLTSINHPVSGAFTAPWWFQHVSKMFRRNGMMRMPNCNYGDGSKPIKSLVA